MDIDFVRQVIGLATRHGAVSLAIEHDGTRIEITRHAGRPVAVDGAPAQAPGEVTPGPLADVAVITSVKAAMAGIAYLSAKPTDAAFVKLGDKVVKGQQVAILEAMKTFSVIKTPVSGEVVEICLSSGDEVAGGEAILRVRHSPEVD